MATGQDSSANKQPSPQQPQPQWRRWVVWLFIALALTTVWSYLNGRHHKTKTLSYSAFKQQVDHGDVKRITIKGQHISGQLRNTGQGKSAQFTTVLPTIDDPHLLDLLQSHDVTIRAEPNQSPIWLRLLINIAPWVLLIGVFVYASKKMRERMQGGSGIFGIGKSRAKRVRGSTSSTRMDDVAGCENAKREVTEIIDFLSHPERYYKLGAAIPKGALLMGPPGAGKTILAKAVAGEAGVPFFSISGSEFIEMFVGVGASRVRDMFKQAKEESPAIIFIDEIDAIGRSRGAGMGGGHDEREQTLNQILSEMDGFSPRETVVVMAATNRPDVLDPALLRPGRFDRKITFELPTRHARKAILEVHARHTRCADAVDFASIAARSIGFSGADLANLINEAAMLAARNRKDHIEPNDFETAFNRIVLGARREDIINDEEKRVIAFHESGHTLLARLLEHADPVERVTIIPRGRTLGATQQTPERERYNLAQSYLNDRICVMLGGRGAEKLTFGEVSTGAAQDLKQATQMARRMVSQWGMSENFGASAFSVEEDSGIPGYSAAQQRYFSEYTARLIDQETRKLIDGAERRVDELLRSHQQKLNKLATTLLERETIEGTDLEQLLAV